MSGDMAYTKFCQNELILTQLRESIPLRSRSQSVFLSSLNGQWDWLKVSRRSVSEALRTSMEERRAGIPGSLACLSLEPGEAALWRF